MSSFVGSFATPFATSFPAFFFGGATFPEAMPFEQGLETYLGDQLGRPIWAGVIPESITPDQLPALVYNLISSEDEQDLEGTTDISCWVVQFDAFAKTRAAAIGLITALKTALLDYDGMMGDVEVLNATRESQANGLEISPSKSGLPTQRRSATYNIWYRDAIPVRN